MDELLDVFDLDLGELIEGGLQALLAGVLLLLGTVVMLASIVVDGVFLWGALLFVGGLVVGVFAVVSFFDVFF
jgi:hypothetical protein